MRSTLYRLFYPKKLSKFSFLFLTLIGQIIDGRKGGLVLGHSHEKSGIMIYFYNGTHFFTELEIEGNEFIVNSFAAEKHYSRLSQINNYNPPEEPYPSKIKNSNIASHIKCRNYKFIYMGGKVCIINAKATNKYLSELVTINKDSYEIKPIWIDLLKNIFVDT